MKNVVITGAAGNLGKEVSAFFLEKGYNVIALVRDTAEANDLTGFVNDETAKLRIEILDLTNEEAVGGFVQGITGEYGHVHAALLLAGGFAMGNIYETEMKAIRAQLAINFETAYTAARHFFKHMMEKGSGRLVFVGTRPALKAAEGKKMVGYALSKSLLFGLADQLNHEAAGKDVVSSLIVPSTIDTPANREAMPDANPGEWVKPLQIAELLHLICSETGAPLRETILKIYGRS